MSQVVFSNYTKVAEPKIKKKTTVKVYSEPSLKNIDASRLEFTEIERFYSDKKPNPHKGIIGLYNLTGLVDRLNSYKGKKKDQDPSILKGIYKGGTSGQYCVEPSSFLPIDIDVKKSENKVINKDEVKNTNVFKYLQSICPLVWRSNSQKGIGAFVYVPQLYDGKYQKNTLLHHSIAKEIYKSIEKLIYDNTSVIVHLDPQQGKFRQIRGLAEQKEIRTLNLTPYVFNYEVTETQIKTKAGVPIYSKPIGFNSGTIPEQFNQNKRIEDLIFEIPNLDMLDDSNRVKYSFSENKNIGFLDTQKNTLINFSGTLANDLNNSSHNITPFNLVLGLNYKNDFNAFIDDLKKQGYKDVTQPKETIQDVKNKLRLDLLKAKKSEVSSLIYKACLFLKTADIDTKIKFIKDTNCKLEYKKYYLEYLGLNKNNLIIYDHQLKAKKYVSECIEDIIELSEKHQKIALKADTGTGKTTAFIKYFRRLKPNARCLFIAPLTIIVDQLKNEYKKENIVFLTGGSRLIDHDIARESNFVVATYEQGIKHLADNNFDYIIVDEIHQFVLANSYKADIIKHATQKILSNNSKVIGLTGTPNRLFNSLGFHIVEIKTKAVKTKVNVRFWNAEPYQIILNHISDQEGRFLFRLNNIDQLENVKNNLVKSGKYAADEILILYSSKEIKGSKDFKQLYKKGSFSKQIKIVLTTSIIDEGLSIKDDFTDSVFINTNHRPEAEPVKQFFARFRNDNVLNNYDLIELSENGNKAKLPRRNFLYLRHTKEPKKPYNFNLLKDFQEKKNILTKDVDQLDYDTIKSTYNDFTDTRAFYFDDAKVNDYYLANHVLKLFYTSINENQFLQYLCDNFNIETKKDNVFEAKKFNTDAKFDKKVRSQKIAYLLKYQLQDVQHILKLNSFDKKLKNDIEPTASLRDNFSDIIDKEQKFIKKHLSIFERLYKIHLTFKFLGVNDIKVLTEDNTLKSNTKIKREIFNLRIQKTLNDPLTKTDRKNKIKIQNVVKDLKQLQSFEIKDFFAILKKNKVYNFDKYTHSTLVVILESGGFKFNFNNRSKIYTIL